MKDRCDCWGWVRMTVTNGAGSGRRVWELNQA
jgi:hypothetical protein